MQVWIRISLFSVLSAATCLATPAPLVQNECQASAVAQRKASRLGAHEDFFLHVVSCLNDPSANLPACILEAKSDLHDEYIKIDKQYQKRLDVCYFVGSGPYDPQLVPAAFSPNVNNLYLPFTPGRTLVYESLSGGVLEHVETTTLASTRLVNGILSREVHDVAYENGVIVEDTLDWVSQDSSGDVWYLGELSMQYEDGFLDDINGSWRYGKDDAKPGRLMFAAPSIGSVYRQEYLPNEAEDMARVLASGLVVNVPAGIFTNCIQTEEWTPIEPGLAHVEYKYYAPGVGLVLEVNAATGQRTELVGIL